jgi:hypothetical protein
MGEFNSRSYQKNYDKSHNPDIEHLNKLGKKELPLVDTRKLPYAIQSDEQEKKETKENSEEEILKNKNITLDRNNFLYFFRGKWIYVNDSHATDALNRIFPLKNKDGSFSLENSKKKNNMFKRTIDAYFKIKPMIKNNTTYLFYSKEYDQGIIYIITTNQVPYTIGLQFKIKTVLQPKNELAKTSRYPDTEKIYMEKDHNFKGSAYLIHYLNSLVSNRKTNPKEISNKKFAKIDLTEDFNLYLTDGKILDTNIHIIELEE